jgi:hypothetical protein
MPSLYKSILIAQPADGDVVFIRRFTRDPPVLASWNATTQQFTLTNGPTLTVVGGTYAGTYPATFTNNAVGTGRPAWLYDAGAVKLQAFSNTDGFWNLQESDYIGNGYSGATYPDPAGPHTTTPIPSFGAPGWTGPTSMSLSDVSHVALVIPAALVSAWRPQ